MKKVTILHNNRCSKSRLALKVLQDENCEIEIIDYIKNTPSKKGLKIILDKLGLSAIEIVRKKEPIFLEKFKGKTFTNSEWIQLLTEHPILIERPIVIDGYKAVIGRPTELVIDLLKRTS
ncbi:MAG: arsenate reductase (glutaredoxin) [Bacteroidia bacterium]|jgi:arsenate reductase|nr:arsenate reductase (glutaredoxin) [Bacteroidia bacterium]